MYKRQLPVLPLNKQFHKPVLHNCFLCLDVPEKLLSDYHAAACTTICLHFHWTNALCLPEYAVSDNMDIYPPATYECHDLLPEEAHPVTADSQ